ncbi:hypothetical protein ACQUQU_15685 [Thalassolituus sp. LLYu03]|uniref:hypothetical protein n=1 Tax=Thalassolituus sp. LLYu03 TaxID=3421656 RepID=UPI003D26D1C5
MSRTLLIALIVLGGWWWLRTPDGLPLEPEGSGLRMGDYRITTLQDDFELTARVLGYERYRSGREADLSPLDLALGWGPMAEPEIAAQFSIRQANRWYYWRTDALPIPRREVETHSANMHMIPADEGVRDQLLALGEGNLIVLSGKLVRVDASDGWHWVSSLTREDTGNGACEVVLVERVSVLAR